MATPFDIQSLMAITSGGAARSGILALRAKFAELSTAPALSARDLAVREKLRSQSTTTKGQSTALASIRTELSTLTSLAARLRGVSSLGSFARASTFSVSSSNNLLATATGTNGTTPAGTFALDVTQLATKTNVTGGTILAKPTITGSSLGSIVATSNLSTLGIAITGSDDLEFKINGVTITVNGNNANPIEGASIQTVLDKINLESVATGVTASFANNRVILTNNNGTPTFNLEDTQGTFLRTGGLLPGSSLTGSSLGAATVLEDLGIGLTGTADIEFKVNGTAITGVKANQTIASVLAKINEQVGVVATIENNRIVIRGTSGFTLEDTQGTFLGSAGLVAQTTLKGTGLVSVAAGAPAVTASTQLQDLGLGIVGNDAVKFKINGTEFTRAADTTIQALLDDINDQNLGVTAKFDTVTKQITLTNLTGGSTFTLEDTRGTLLGTAGLVSQTSMLGTATFSGVNTSTTKLSDLGINISTTDDIEFSINGKAITGLTGNSTVQEVLDKITAELNLEVEAKFVNNKFVLTNVSGSTSFTLQDTAGGFLRSAGLLSQSTTTRTGGELTGSTVDTQMQNLAGLALGVNNATFTINGVEITNIDRTTKISGLITKINAQTGATGVYATFDSANKKIVLSTINGGTTITVANVAGQPDMVSILELGTGSGLATTGPTSTSTSSSGTTSTGAAGTIVNSAGGEVFSGQLVGTSKLSNLTGLTPSSGMGSFQINGTTINFNASDSINTVIGAINNAGLGVTASFDDTNDKITLISNNTGANSDFTLQDGTGNLLTTAGLLAGGAKTLGQDNAYTLTSTTGGTTTVKTGTSSDNTLTAAETEVAGLQINSISTGTATITVTLDVEGNIENAKGAIVDFFNQFNKVQDTLATHTREGGVLQSDPSVSDVAQRLRQAMSGVFSQLGDSVTSNSRDNKLTFNQTQLLQALEANPEGIDALFRQSGGVAARIESVASPFSGRGFAKPDFDRQ